MNVLYDHIIRCLKIEMCKIPDCLDPVLHQDICHFLGFILGKCQNRDLHVILSQEKRKLTEHLDLKSTDCDALKHRIYVKDTNQPEPALLKIHIIGKCLSQITGTQDDHRMNGIQSQDLTDLCIKIVYIIAIPLLPKTAEIIKILTDLRSCGMHLLT